MRLTLDIGNTMAKFVFFDDDDSPRYHYLTKTNTERSYDEIASSFRYYLQTNSLENLIVDEAIISSVVPSLTEIYASLLDEVFHVRAKLLGPGLKSGIAIRTDNPKEVGADLIADAVGAKSLFGHSVLIADMGTANKMILLDEHGGFAGCSIAPGLGLGLKALVSNTAALMDVSLQIPPKIIGKNTPDSMNSGLLYGVIHSLKGMAKQVEMEAGYPLKLVLTGGYSKYVKDALPEFEYIPDLLAFGLLCILKGNHGKNNG